MKLFIFLAAVLVASGNEYSLSSWRGYNSRRLRKVAVGGFGVWGLDSNNKIYYKESGSDTFTSYYGTLFDISVGKNEVWGVSPGSQGAVYRKIGGGRWENMGGGLVQVSVSDNGHLWAVNKIDLIYRRTGSTWTKVYGNLVMVNVGKAGVWGVNKNGGVYYRLGTYGDPDVAGTGWLQVPGSFKWISSGNGFVIGITTSGDIFYRAGITSSVPTGNSWVRVTGLAQQIDTYNTQVWCRNLDDELYSLTLTPEPCQLTRIEILSASQDRQYLGTKIVGISSAGSCFGSGTGVLVLSHSSSVEESIGIELSEESGIDWSVSTSVEVSAGFKIFGASAEVTVGLEVGVGGSKTFGKSESQTTTSISGSGVEHQTYYTAPGAALSIGVLEKYSTDLDAVPVRQHYHCSSGTTYTLDSTIKLSQQHYEAAHFEDMRGTFYQSACVASGYSLPDCVSGLKSSYNGFVGDISVLRQQFAACFADGKGDLSKE